MTVTDASTWQNPGAVADRGRTTAQGELARALTAQHISRGAGCQGNWFADILGGGAAEGERRGDPRAEPRAGVQLLDRSEAKSPVLVIQEGTLPSWLQALPGKGFPTVSAFTVCSGTLTSKSNVTVRPPPQHTTQPGPELHQAVGIGAGASLNSAPSFLSPA